jgi:hypothetical protein
MVAARVGFCPQKPRLAPSSILLPASAWSGWPKKGDVLTPEYARGLERDPREPRYILTLHGLGYSSSARRAAVRKP